MQCRKGESKEIFIDSYFNIARIYLLTIRALDSSRYALRMTDSPQIVIASPCVSKAKQSAGFAKETSFCERSEATIQIAGL